MPLYQLNDTDKLDHPTLIVALDSWVDAGSASTTAAGRLAEGGEVVATFDADLIFDYRSRRPILEIVDGRPAELTWPELTIRRNRIGNRTLLVLTGSEPDFRWHELAEDSVEVAKKLGVVEWISLGAIPAAVPHTRPVPVIGTASRPGLLKGDVQQGPEGVLRVPSAAISALDFAISRSDIPTIGYFAQVPHYISGPYPAAAVELLRAIGRHLDEELPISLLEEEARVLRERLDAVVEADETTKGYVERLESMVDEARLPSGDELIAEIERFLRDGGSEGSQRS